MGVMLRKFERAHVNAMEMKADANGWRFGDYLGRGIPFNFGKNCVAGPNWFEQGICVAN
jgi:hypothetical protein